MVCCKGAVLVMNIQYFPDGKILSLTDPLRGLLIEHLEGGNLLRQILGK